MSLSFNAAAVNALFSAVVSQAQTLGIFENVGQHEPKNAPGPRLHCAIWVDSIKPAPSGLASVSGEVTFHLRIYSPMLAEPQDGIDPEILSATCALMAAYAGAFTLGGTVRNVDVMQCSAQAGYINQDSRLFRAMVVALPIIINDLWDEVA